MANVIDPDVVMTTLTVAAGLSLGVERITQLLKQLFELGNSNLSTKEKLNFSEKAEKHVENAEKIIKKPPTQSEEEKSNIPIESDEKIKASSIVTDEVIHPIPTSGGVERYAPPRIKILPALPLSHTTTAKALFIQLSACGLGIILAWMFNIRLIHLLTQREIILIPSNSFLLVLDIIFSGLVIGGGSQPIHVLMRFLTERRIPKDLAEAIEEPQPIKDLAMEVSASTFVVEKKEAKPFEWKPIVYEGGINRDALATEHIRPANPNQIVYHHTAMATTATFQDIVDEFLVNKKWLTGYHCVVMPNGNIRPFCRWDRYGNHAKGINSLSLGVALHGNFHTDPQDQYSNADGRYGNQKPTESQLHAAARLVALWVNLYQDISLDFESAILPHKIAVPRHTVCPGSNFPYDEFQQLIKTYCEEWETSEEAQTEIKSFMKNQYIYV